MPNYFKLRKGLDIRMKGVAPLEILNASIASEFAIIPFDFFTITPKPLVKPGDTVKAGTPIFYSKDNPEIKFASPVSGTIKEIKRGERRVIEAFIIESDGKFESETFSILQDNSKEKIIEKLTETCAWPFIRQRPYNIIAKPTDSPRDIFISGFDSAPLAPDMEYLLKGKENYIQKGIDILKELTVGKIYVGLNKNIEGKSIFNTIKGIEINYFSGAHPAGNVGVQMHHVKPINKGEVVWVINPEDLIVIGKIFSEGKYDVTRTIALAGSELEKAGYVSIVQGSKINHLIQNNENEVRVISGNVLTGSNVGKSGYLGFYDRIISVIPEGNYYEFLGWALPGFGKFSASKTFFSWLTPKKQYKLDTNYHGGERALVMSGEYEKVVPMDILPQHLVKAIIIQDVELMEKLGIYEVVEEDLALCDFVCTSKTEVQHIVRQGLELMIKEMS